MTTNSDEAAKDYFISGGTRIDLTRADDLIAIDRRQLASSSSTLNLPKSAKTLSQGIEPFAAAAVDEKTLNELTSCFVVRPVYRSPGSILVLLPEIRIESSDSQTLSQIAQKLNIDSKGSLQESPGRLTWHIQHEHCSQTLQLANQLAENFPEISVSPRFLRIVESPDIAG